MEKTIESTGLRVKSSGTIYVDRKVFYARTGVKDVIKAMSESKAYPNTNITTKDTSKK